VTKTSQNITVIGAGINGLVAANYLVFFPCGSAAGTPGYMCVSESLRNMGR
jgi:hypothetical protein